MARVSKVETATEADWSWLGPDNLEKISEWCEQLWERGAIASRGLQGRIDVGDLVNETLLYVGTKRDFLSTPEAMSIARTFIFGPENARDSDLVRLIARRYATSVSIEPPIEVGSWDATVDGGDAAEAALLDRNRLLQSPGLPVDVAVWHKRCRALLELWAEVEAMTVGDDVQRAAWRKRFREAYEHQKATWK